MHRGDQDHSFRHAALLDDRRDVVGDANEFLTLPGVEPQVVGKYVHLVI
jgi:hypothetical protein